VGAYSPQLGAAPNDFTVALNFSGGGLYGPAAVAIDASGNAWVADEAFYRSSGSAITEISSYGTFLTGISGFTNASITTPDAIAVDDSGNAWIGDDGLGGSLEFTNEISSAGSLLPPPHGYGGGTGLLSVAIDGLGNAWFGGPQVRKYSSSGLAVSTPAYTGGGLTTTSNSIAIDGAGSAWVPSSTGTVAKLSSTGTFLSGTNGYTPSGCCGRGDGIAIDSSGNAWIASTPGVVELSNSGAVLSGTSGYPSGSNGLSAPVSIAIDGAGNVWVVNGSSGSDLAELSSTGVLLSGTNGYQNANLGVPTGLAIDGSGDIWVTNQGYPNPPTSSVGNVIEFIGVATPVVTPIAAGLPATPTANGSSSLGTRP
jgi:sugar lactone lactonase YvrE